jgi:uncharacterized protein YbjQ (UPF0145 family)
MNISDEAVEAAVDALVMTRMGDYNIELNEFRKAAKEVLEAAAPHLMAEALEDLALQAESFGDDGITSIWIRTRRAGAGE